MAEVQLSVYLSAAAARPWQWGEIDCFLFCADWVMARWGVDPAGEFRGAYASEREARALMKREGGIIALANRCLSRAGLRVVSRDVAGLVGLVRAPILIRGRRIVSAPVGGIYLGHRMWAIRTREGVMAQMFKPIEAWDFAGA